MAKLKKNAVIAGLSGSLGPDHYARQTKDGETIISLKPDFSNRQFSEAQLEQQSGMKAASAYASAIHRVHPIYARKAEGTSKNSYNVAVGDWFNAPVIHRIQWKDGHIKVLADDDVMVTRVTITIVGEAGEVLEQGDANQSLKVWWDYQATQRGLIRVEAWDLPGNVTAQEFAPLNAQDVWRKNPR